MKKLLLTLTLTFLAPQLLAQEDPPPPFTDDERIILDTGKLVWQEWTQLKRIRTENGELGGSITALNSRIAFAEALATSARGRGRNKAAVALDTVAELLTAERDKLQDLLDNYVDPSARISTLGDVLDELYEELLLLAPEGRDRQHYVDYVKS